MLQTNATNRVGCADHGILCSAEKQRIDITIDRRRPSLPVAGSSSLVFPSSARARRCRDAECALFSGSLRLGLAGRAEKPRGRSRNLTQSLRTRTARG